MIKYVFYFLFKALFVLQIFTFLFRVFGFLEKRLDKKVMISFKIYGVTDWTTNNQNTYITKDLKK